jgi:integrase
LNRPVEYSVAVDRFLAAAALSAGSRRIYRIALATWAWALVEHTPPRGERRRNAAPPALPLPLLDTPRAVDRLREAFAARSEVVGVRTANRELSVLVGAVKWWRAQGWLTGDPTAGLRPLPLPKPRGEGARIGAEQARAVLELAAPLREQTFWHLLYETGAPIERVLGLDVDDLDLAGRRTLARADPPLRWGDGAARLLPLLALGRTAGPLFATSRGRLSYRRAAEIFRATTRPLDLRGRGWTLHQLSAAGRGRE